MSKSFLKRESEKQRGDRRGNQDDGGGQGAGKRRSFAGLRDVALKVPEISQKSKLDYNGEFPTADALFREFGVNTLDKVIARLLLPEYRLGYMMGNGFLLTFHSLDSIENYYEGDGYDSAFQKPSSDDFVAVTAQCQQIFRVAKTEQDHFLTTMISRYSALSVFSAVTVLDAEEDRFFFEENERETFLDGIPEIMRNAIDEPLRPFLIPPERGCSNAYPIDSNGTLEKIFAPDLIAPLVESYHKISELDDEIKGFRFYYPDGVFPSICITTKEPNDADGICPVRLLYDQEVDMCCSCDTGGFCGWWMISQTFSANRSGLLREHLEWFLKNVSLTLRILEKIGHEY